MDTTISCKEALMKAYPYKLELHAHTWPVSPCSEMKPAEVVQRYQALGAHGIVITNHAIEGLSDLTEKEWARWYLQDYREAKAEGEKLGIQVYLGMEIRFPGNCNDYLVYGIDEAFVEQAWDFLHTDLHTFYQACAAPDRVIVQAHPCRNGIELADPADLDGVEVYNQHPGHNSRVAMAAAYQATVGGIVTGGTDFHHRGHEGMLYTCFKTLPQDSFELAKLLHAGDYVFRMGDSIILP